MNATSFQLAAPQWLLVALPALALVLFVMWKGYLGSPAWRRSTMAALRICAILAVLIALARPDRVGVDPRMTVMAVIDISASADADDLAAARVLVEELAAGAGGDTGVGLCLFATRAMLITPPRTGSAPGADELALLDALIDHRRRRAAGDETASDDARASEVIATCGIEDSDLAAGLRLARGIMPATSRRRIILVSDGNATKGEATAEAERAAADGIVVEVLAARPRSAPEILVEEMVAPTLVHVREPFDLEIRVKSSRDTTAELLLSRNGFVLPVSGTIELRAGHNVLAFANQMLDEGFHSYEALVRAPAGTDTNRGNNTGRLAITASGRPRVLMISDDRDATANLVEALRGEEIAVEERPSTGMASTIEGLLAFDLVLLCDVPAAALPRGAMEALRNYVRDHGGGIGMIGGEHSFGLGGYARTPVEDVLPVEMTVRKSIDDPNLALVNVIDASGSMSGDKMELAKEAAIAAADVVQGQDRVGVVAFDSQPYLYLPLTSASEKSVIVERVSRITAGGGTDIEPALQMAFELLQEDRDARIKHVILLSDGQAPGRPDQLAGTMRAQGITVSTVAVGQGADAQLLKDIAQRGGGRAYFTDDFASVPQIFTQETLTAAKSLLVEDPTLAVLRDQDRVIDGIDLESLPILFGYVATTPKPDAAVVLVSDLSDPILAIGRAGVGWGMAFTSDVRHRWATDWLEDFDDFPKLWAQIVRRTMRAGRDGAVVATGALRSRADELEVEIDLSDFEGRFLSELQVSAVMQRGAGAEATSAVAPLDLIAPGLYRARVAAARPGVATRIEVEARSGAELVMKRTLSHVEPYAREHRAVAPDQQALAAIARSGGGAVITEASGAFDFKSPPGARRGTIAGWFLALAAGALIVEIAVRRI